MKTQTFRSVALVCALFVSVSLQAQDKLMDILKSELKYEMEQLGKTEYPPYYMNYRVAETSSNVVRASFGTLVSSTNKSVRSFVPQIRIGSYDFDNFHGQVNGVATSFFMGPQICYIPQTDEELAIRQAIWSEVNDRYKYAVETYEKLKAADNVYTKTDDKAPDFSDAQAEKYYEEPFTAEELNAFDAKLFEEKLKKYSALFLENPNIIEGEAAASYNTTRRYFVSSEGAEIAENSRACRIFISGMMRTDDGMELPLNLSYYAFDPKGLPSDEKIMADVRELIATLEAMRTAPAVEPYTGPALLSGEASGVFFHEIFGHRTEGQRMKRDSDGQTFKKMIGEYVLPKHFSAYDDPTLKNYNGQDMNGYYVFDDQGVRGRRVEVVKDGILNEFLMTRVPTDEFGQSNGHARASEAYDPVSRQSNLVIETSKHLTDEQLRKLLIKEAKAQKKEYAYFFKTVTGGFTQTGRMSPNSFNVTPLEVYRIYVDGRPDELVRGVDLIGTPLSMFSSIIEGGGEVGVFTGTCGAESGWVPVTASSPAILVKKVELQRKSKSMNTVPVLERPSVSEDPMLF